MEVNHKLTLYVSYYLSRFDIIALENLGYSTWKQAFTDISKKLDVNVHSVKNWRDEFDPIHDYRVGWHKRPMIPSRVQIVRALENLDEEEIRSLVSDILSGEINNEPENLDELIKVVSRNEKKSNFNFILRGPTGRKAEEYFIHYHKSNSKPIKGELIDTRDQGCGYDFEIKDDSADTFYIEVKGLAKKSGGVLFTNKEWKKAKEFNEKYILVLISNIEESPEIKFIQNPGSFLNPKRNVVTSIQIQWSVPEKDLLG